MYDIFVTDFHICNIHNVSSICGVNSSHGMTYICISCSIYDNCDNINATFSNCIYAICN